jgi:hypothetical protein
MTRSQTLARTLSAALAISAIAVPTAGARPIDVGLFQHKDATSPVSVNARGADVSAPDQQAPAITPRQDLRTPDARDAGERAAAINAQQDLRTPDARDAGERAAAITPQQTLRSPDARAAGRGPHGPLPTLTVPVQANDRDGTPWSTIGLALVGCLALAGTAATAGRIRRRAGRAGVTA